MPADSTAEARYRARAGAICRDVDRRVDALGQPASERELRSYFGRVLAIGQPALRRLAALRPPRRLAARVRRVLGLARQEIRLIEQLAREMRTSPDPAATLEAFQPRIESLVGREDALWRSLGIPDCADEGGAPSSDAPLV